MDNVPPTVIGDVLVGGVTRKAIYYGSKSSLTFILDRTNGKPITGVIEHADGRRTRVRSDAHSRRIRPSAAGRPGASCTRSWAPNNIPGNPCRAVPNYNGYQADAAGNPGLQPGELS